MWEPLGPTKGDSADLRPMLHHLEREVPAPAADRPRGLRERHSRGAEHRPPIALAERSEPLDLFDCMERDTRERGLAVDRELGPAE